MIIYFDLKILVSCSMYTYYENEMIDTLNQVIVTLCHVSQEGDKKNWEQIEQRRRSKEFVNVQYKCLGLKLESET